MKSALTMETEVAETNPCRLCGNDFIEIFGGSQRELVSAIGESRWWCGCKPCSKRDGGQEHAIGKTRDEAIAKWNERNPDSAGERDGAA